MIEFINQAPLLGLMLVTSLGYALGRVTVRGLSAGPAGGTLLVALLLGHAGVSLAEFYGPESHLTLGTLGFVLFIYSVGFEAGPRFFAGLGTRNGWRFVSVAVFVNLIALLVAVIWGRLLDLDAATVAGMLAGALTSAPTYAVASQLVDDGARLSVAFAITYPVGLVGLVVLIQTLPARLNQNLAAGALNEDEWHAKEKGRRGRQELSRAFLVQEAAATERPLRELNLTHTTGCVLARILRDGEPLVPDGETVLRVGDRVLAVGRMEELRQLERQLGPEISTVELEGSMPPPRRILVRQAEADGRSLAELQLVHRFHCVVTAIERGTEEIEPAAEVRLLRNDIVELSGARDDVRRAAAALGEFEPAVDETNIAIYTGGIFLGLLIGGLHLGLLGFDFKLGDAAGLLLAGLFLGWRGRLGSWSTHVPKAARQLVRDLGILLFIGETGLAAGANLMAGLRAAPWANLVGAGVITLVTVLASLLLAVRVLRLRPLDAWGSLCGGLTSSAALQALRKTADSRDVTISYAAAYALASVLATFAGQVIVAFF